MSPELEKETIVACAGVLFSAFFAGVPAALLFWWTWRRDQERLLVQKYLEFADTLDGKSVILRDSNGAPSMGILIRNRSLFSVRVSAVGFDIDGLVIQLANPSFIVRLKRNPDPSSNYPNIPSDDNPKEIPSGASTLINLFSEADSETIRQALTKAAERRRTSIDNVLQSRRVAALVALESGRQFSSLSPTRRVWTKLYSLATTPFRRIGATRGKR